MIDTPANIPSGESSRLAEVAGKALAAGTGEQPSGAPPSTEPKQERRGGARPGSGRKPKGTNAASEAKRETRAAPSPPTAEEIQAYAFLGGTLWDISARFFKLGPLTPEESTKLGAALAPVVNKWAPAIDEWASEFNLVVLVLGLWQTHRLPKTPVENGELFESRPAA